MYFFLYGGIVLLFFSFFSRLSPLLDNWECCCTEPLLYFFCSWVSTSLYKSQKEGLAWVSNLQRHSAQRCAQEGLADKHALNFKICPTLLLHVGPASTASKSARLTVTELFPTQLVWRTSMISPSSSAKSLGQAVESLKKPLSAEWSCRWWRQMSP